MAFGWASAGMALGGGLSLFLVTPIMVDLHSRVRVFNFEFGLCAVMRFRFGFTSLQLALGSGAQGSVLSQLVLAVSKGGGRPCSRDALLSA